MLVVGVIVGFATGGSLRNFPSIPLRSWWFAVAGIALQFVNPPGALGHLAVAASFALLLVFAVLNIDRPGLLLFAVGVSLNALVVIANGGMPITRDAVIRSDQGGTLPALETGAGGAKHHLANEDSVLLVLGDVTGRALADRRGGERRGPRPVRRDRLVRRGLDAARRPRPSAHVARAEHEQRQRGQHHHPDAQHDPCPAHRQQDLLGLNAITFPFGRW